MADGNGAPANADQLDLKKLRILVVDSVREAFDPKGLKDEIAKAVKEAIDFDLIESVVKDAVSEALGDGKPKAPKIAPRPPSAKEYEVVTPIDMDLKRYEPGDTIRLTNKEASYMGTAVKLKEDAVAS
jgi:hypothetical protein